MKQKILVAGGMGYIGSHTVVDLAKAHGKACERLMNEKDNAPYEVFNIGTGTGLSVMEVIDTFEKENSRKLNYSMGPRRAGDAAAIYADVEKANAVLQWKAEKNIVDMVKDAWRWEMPLNEAAEKNKVSA